MKVFKKLLILMFTIFRFVNAHLNYDEHKYTPLETKCNIDGDVDIIFLRDILKRKCICKDGTYHCRTLHPHIGYENYRARVQKWISDNYDAFCVKQTQELIVKGWTCLCLEKKTWWCTKMPIKNGKTIA